MEVARVFGRLAEEEWFCRLIEAESEVPARERQIEMSTDKFYAVVST
jgi:hypothetical protein